MATETLANLAKYKKARRMVRKYGDISKLVALLDIDSHQKVNLGQWTMDILMFFTFGRCAPAPWSRVIFSQQDNNAEEVESIEDGEVNIPLYVLVAKGAAFALWSLSKSEKNKKVIADSNGIPMLARLVRMKHTSVLIPAIGTLQECASNREYLLVG